MSGSSTDYCQAATSSLVYPSEARKKHTLEKRDDSILVISLYSKGPMIRC